MNKLENIQIEELCQRTLKRISPLLQKDELITQTVSIPIESTFSKTIKKNDKLNQNSTNETNNKKNEEVSKAFEIANQRLFISSLKENNIISQNNKKLNKFDHAISESGVYDDSGIAAPALIAKREKKKKTLGNGWFNMEPMDLDEKTKRDIKLLKLRNYLDPKRFYKNPDRNGKILHVGTVIEGPTEYISSRINRKDRKKTIMDEILSDSSIKQYTKKAYLAIQEQKSNKRKIFSKNKLRGNKKSKK